MNSTGGPHWNSSPHWSRPVGDERRESAYGCDKVRNYGMMWLFRSAVALVHKLDQAEDLTPMMARSTRVRSWSIPPCDHG